MSLIPLKEYAKENPYGFFISTLRGLAKKPGGDKILRRVSARMILVDTEALDEWLQNQKYYTTKRAKKAKGV